MRSLLIAAFLIICFGASAQSKDEEVWKRVEALSNAVFATKDSNSLNDLVSDRVTYGHSGGNLEKKQEMVHNAAVSKTTYKNSEFERLSIDVDKKTAIVRHNFRAISVDEKGVETPLNLGILQVWKKENGKWRIWARQAVKIAPKS
ncbi:nuclear transport factor 2 family protein [Chitinophagaceae bacterium LB-8]|uniref:Nuclear transport factor 2 family protein n=1 Tax=Paraflavisolibacter caeni TaxID=2982496 RepID=A0A9X2XUD4_9BACT|nr:nuclear transport factor 2 family protein [Paraflavisolibacter caeni]MCU7547863.1 nuclear transport factor 2 family protein [Paraflavisolibacter caeni]